MVFILIRLRKRNQYGFSVTPQNEATQFNYTMFWRKKLNTISIGVDLVRLFLFKQFDRFLKCIIKAGTVIVRWVTIGTAKIVSFKLRSGKRIDMQFTWNRKPHFNNYEQLQLRVLMGVYNCPLVILEMKKGALYHTRTIFDCIVVTI